MKLTDHDLLQFDERYLASLEPGSLLAVSKKLLSDLKESRERLNQTPDNSSRPPSSRSPYLGIPEEGGVDSSNEHNEDVTNSSVEKGKSEKEDDDHRDGNGSGGSDSTGKSRFKKQKRKAGKQVGAPGYGRQQKIPAQREEIHKADKCVACDAVIPLDIPFAAQIGFFVLELISGTLEHPGLRLECTKHLFGDSICGCGHVTRTGPGIGERHVVEGRKDATCLSEWRLIGPMLAAFIVALNLRMRLSRPRIREFLMDWFSLELSAGTIDKCIRKAGLAVNPIYQDELIDEARQSGLINVDETPWKEKGVARWLWVFVTANTVLFFVGRRTQQVVLDILTEAYAGWLMSDGLMNYRIFSRRLRCLAHLIRKARGLAESLDAETKLFGDRTLEVLEFVVGQVRDGPDRTIFQPILSDFKWLCEWHRAETPEGKLRSLAVEFLNDWDVIWMTLEHPDLPLTNNEAERALRHWVIARLISHGTRTAEGSRVFTVLASVIETCRRRKVSPWTYLATVIAERKKGNPSPALPVPMVV
ncbi:MAG: IS66 family transposase [Magnetococcales bacterium]|nr:IS66 family transposase [Magnetococcales bacterium]MBF0321433.1 IS66 family transposase [Magnetococcales bacterium]